MSIAGVDPGKHKCAYAWASDGWIEYVAYEPAQELSGYHCDELHVEVPQIYPGVSRKNPNDLIEVSISLGRVIQGITHSELVRYYPRQWKGNIKKPVMTARIKKILEASGEIETLIEAGFENNPDVLDACGIVLHALGRLRT